MLISRRSFAQALAAGAAATTLPAPVMTAKAAQSADALLARIDEIRLPQQSFAVDVTLTAYENGASTDQSRVTTYSRKSPDDQFLTIVHIDQPSIDRGKILLRNGNILWVYDPSSKASVRISPRQRLLGNASNGDVISANFRRDYHAEIVGTERVIDGDRKEQDATKLNLVSSGDYAPYDRIELWSSTTDDRPLKGKFYTASGELLKVAWYRKWENEMSEIRPTETIIADGFNPRNVTVMNMRRYHPRDLPQSWFRKEWLPRFQK